MTYVLRGLLAEDGHARSVATQFVGTRSVPLAQGLALIPLPDATLVACRLMEPDSKYEAFYMLGGEPLPAPLADLLRDVSADGVVAYVEAEYFGGLGGQASVVFDRGSLVFGPVQEGGINQALRYFGVTVEPAALDEFDSVGLGRHRGINDWLTSIAGP
jgi:hypothetical protein